MGECPGVVDTHWGSVMSETGVDTRAACDSLDLSLLYIFLKTIRLFFIGIFLSN